MAGNVYSGVFPSDLAAPPRSESCLTAPGDVGKRPPLIMMNCLLGCDQTVQVADAAMRESGGAEK